MSPRHDRKRPGGHTPVQLYAQPEGISVARLDPEDSDPTPAPAGTPVLSAVPALQDDPVVPPAAAAEPAPAAEPASGAASPVAATTQPAVPAPAPVPAPQIDPKQKVTTSVQVSLLLKKQAETAIKTTGHLEGSYASWARFVNGAIAHELERLADQFNEGQPFPENAGEFRNGRPLGS